MNKKIVLIIYLLSFCNSTAQTLLLKYKASQTSEQIILDSISKNKSFPNFKALKKYNDSLINQLNQKGYVNLLPQPLQKTDEFKYQQKIELNKRVKTIEIIANPLNKEIDSLVEVMLSRKRGENFYNFEEVEEKLKELHRFISNNGFSFLKIQANEFETKEEDTITLNINLSINKKRKIDKIIIKGYDQFPEKYIRKITNQNLVFNQSNIVKVKSAFKQIPFTTIVKEPEILFKKDSTFVYIYLKKKNSNSADGLIGFNNSDNGKLELNGYIDLTLYNNLNNGEKLTILYRGDNDDQTRLDINTEFPYILKSNLGITAGLNLLRRDSTYQNTTITTGLFYALTPQMNIGLSYNKKNSTVQEINITNNNSKSDNLVLNLNHQKPAKEDIFLSDILAEIQISIGNRTIESNTNRQTLITSTIHKNLYIDKKQSIHLENHIKFLGSNNILFNELFQVGGSNSIRGFNQNSIDTSSFLSLNTEYRHRISSGIYLHSILDYAIFEDYTTNKTQNIYGIGFGAAILTQSGILKLSIANGTFSGANMDFSSTVAHLNMQIIF
ncbi:ShlB/FhaC/HecB family hemolysin secretion/activation protein [Nonlabens sp. Asnod3-H03]|uniref:ShlB/FhaC/HecB family hemolysin secretion/activation protein n=1 Tax=Nonlabens sp. Asnod3-H03 TaxID=3160580 RepID=UPI00386A2152